jgi:hypothetical protein
VLERSKKRGEADNIDSVLQLRKIARDNRRRVDRQRAPTFAPIDVAVPEQASSHDTASNRK